LENFKPEQNETYAENLELFFTLQDTSIELINMLLFAAFKLLLCSKGEACTHN